MTDLASRHAGPDRPGGPGPRSPSPGAWRSLWPHLLVVVAGLATALAAESAPVVVLGAMGLLAGVWVVARPESAATVAVALLYSNAVVIAVKSHGAPGALAAIVPLLLLVTVSYRVFARREPFLLPRPGLWVVALVVAQVLGAMSSRDPGASVTAWRVILTEGLVLFALITNAVRGYEMIRRVALLVVVLAAALGTLSMVQDLTNATGTYGGFASKSNAVVNKDDGGGKKRHAGPIGEKNRWAQTLAIVLPIAGALAATDRSRTVRTIALVSGVGIVIGIVLTYSRGALVGLVLTGIVAMALRWVKVRAIFVVGVVAVIGISTFSPAFAERAGTVREAGSSLTGSGSGSSTDGSVNNRTAEATAAISVFFRHPVIGVGVGLFPTYYQDEARSQGADRIVGVDREAHDLYLGLAAESGLVGLLAFAGLSSSILRPLGSVRRRHLDVRSDVAGLATGFALAFVTYLTTGFFLHFAYIRYFWLLAALATCMGLVDEVDPRPRLAPENALP